MKIALQCLINVQSQSEFYHTIVIHFTFSYSNTKLVSSQLNWLYPNSVKQQPLFHQLLP